MLPHKCCRGKPSLSEIRGAASRAQEGWSALRIVEAGGPNALSVLQHRWQTLQAQCPQATPFQTWEWNAAWWRHFGARKRPRILLFWAQAEESAAQAFDAGGKESFGAGAECGRRGEVLIGLAPFYTSFHLGTPLRRLAWIGTGHSDYLAPLAAQGYEEAVALALRDYLDGQLRGWDIADLQQMRPDAPLLRLAICADGGVESAGAATAAGTEQATGNALRLRKSPRAMPAQTVLPIEPCPYVALPADWNTFAGRLGKKMRSNLGYYDRLLQKTFAEARYGMADTGSLQEGMTALFDLHQKRWNARWLPGVLGSRRVQAFHRDVAQIFLENGWLRLHLLTVEGTIRAALYCFSYGGRTFYYLGGFAPEMGKYSLGTLLTARAIRTAIEEGCTEFDFLRGSEPYKYRWLPEERMNHRLLLLRSRHKLGGLGALPGRAGYALNRVERYVTARAKAFAEQQGRKERTVETPVPGAV